MLSIIKLVTVLIVGLVLGGSLSWFSIQTNHGVGALKIGSWTAWPLAGDRNSDPYTRAKVAAQGEVPLGAAEGIAFHAETDSNGDALQRGCTYRLDGQTPIARLWTLTAHQLEGAPLNGKGANPASLVSRSVVRRDNGRFLIHAGPLVSPENWLLVSGNGPYQLVLRLYDTPITGTGEVLDATMPTIVKLSCRS